MKAKKKKIETYKPEDLGLDFVSYLLHGTPNRNTAETCIEPTSRDYLGHGTTQATGRR